MQLASHYLQLRKSFSGFRQRQPFKTRVEEIAGALYCSERNVKVIVKRLASEGWIEWKPGRGRGIGSTLTFLADAQHILLQEAQALVRQGQLQDALSLLKEYDQSSDLKATFMNWLGEYMGYHEESMPELPRDTLRIPMSGKIISLDPAYGVYSFEGHLARQVYDTLMVYNSKRGAVEGRLAHHMEHSPDWTRWTFHLRKGVMFHHGRELNAEDVVFTFERLLREGHYRRMFAFIDRVEAYGKYTVHFLLRKPNVLFPRFLCAIMTSILPRDVVEKQVHSIDMEPVGTGPFKNVEMQRSRFILEANPVYFSGRPFLDRLEFYLMPSKSEDCQRDAKWRKLVTLSDIPSLKEARDGLVAHGKSYCSSTISLNVNKPGPQQCVKFRQALRRGLNRMALLQLAELDAWTPATGFRAPIQAYKFDIEYDFAEAKQLLQQSNYAGEVFMLGTASCMVGAAKIIQHQMEALGIRMEYVELDSESMVQPESMLKMDGVLCGVILDEDEVTLMEVFTADYSKVYHHLSPSIRDQVLHLFEAAMGEPNDMARSQIFDEIEQQLRDEALVLFLTHNRHSTVYHPSLEGVQHNSLGYIDYKDIWIRPTFPAQ
ncbi:ABC transporter substrate-binding protein [Paenibacillus turpanensis]|uniref:ABC transporter substrate-binding protein n=1 Tax=Paenibacillus turpanensis TaxID=2689078 RepID=UPI00140768A4|nr:ABC transporter substrate-binding protein [Paenibacillus turpanensis]